MTVRKSGGGQQRAQIAQQRSIADIDSSSQTGMSSGSALKLSGGADEKEVEFWRQDL